MKHCQKHRGDEGLNALTHRQASQTPSETPRSDGPHGGFKYLRNDSKAGAGEARGIWGKITRKTRQRPLRKNIHAALRDQKVNKVSQVAQFNVP